MNPLLRFSFRLIDRLSPPETVRAHCDIPCGIYDPHVAQIGALTCIRMNQLINDLGDAPGPGDKQKNDAWHNSLSRYVTVKEGHGDVVKKEWRIIWGDYFKPEPLERHPKLHETVWNIMKLGSTCRQQINMQAAQDLLAEGQKFAEAFWATKNASVARHQVEGESMAPNLATGERVVVNKAAYLFSQPRPGDRVVVRDPRQPDRLLLQRIEGP